MISLLKETLTVLKDNGKTEKDVKYVVCEDQLGTWKDFSKLADVEHYDRCWMDLINTSLRIVGDNWWLESEDLERWSYKEMPKMPSNPKPLINI